MKMYTFKDFVEANQGKDLKELEKIWSSIESIDLDNIEQESITKRYYSPEEIKRAKEAFLKQLEREIENCIFDSKV